MTETIEIRMDGAPVAKARSRSTRSGHHYTTEKTANFATQLGWAARAVMKDRPLLTGALQIVCFSFVPIPMSWSAKKKAAALSGSLYPISKPDCDNFLKGVCDSCNKVVWQDDAQVVTATIHKRYSERPRTEISISPLIGS
jgi:Holliday junction resolvase RusA-like endonuclease